MTENNFIILEGDVFVCIKDVEMEDRNGPTGEIRFQAGLVYISEINGCITNNEDNKTHSWSKFEAFSQYFKLIKYSDKQREILKDDLFLCLKSVMVDAFDMSPGYSSFYYKEGQIYKSEKDKCITDENKNTEHRWTAESYDPPAKYQFNKVFKRII